jgi:hypothetical protein
VVRHAEGRTARAGFLIFPKPTDRAVTHQPERAGKKRCMAAGWLKNVATFVAQLFNPASEPRQHVVHEISRGATRAKQLARRGADECLLV